MSVWGFTQLISLKRKNCFDIFILMRFSSRNLQQINHFHHLAWNRSILSQRFCRPNAFYSTTYCLQERRTYYQILNVKQFALAKEIKSAYYEIAKQCHPDVNSNDKNAAKKFREASEAYEILSDDSKRANYDAGLTGSTASESFRKEPYYYGDDNEYAYRWEDINPDEQKYKDFRRRWSQWTDWTDWNRKTNKRKRNEDSSDYEFNGYMFLFEKNIWISMQEAAEGLTREFKIRHPLRNFDNKKEKLSATVKINPGIEDKEVLQVVIGDIMECLFTIRIKNSDNLKRIGKNVYSVRWISKALAKYGGSIRVNGLYGDLELTIPAGTRPLTNFQMSDQGFQDSKSDENYGHHFVLVKIRDFEHSHKHRRKKRYCNRNRR